MYTEISFFIYQIENNPKLSWYTVGKAVGKQEFFYIAGEDVNLSNPFGRQFDFHIILNQLSIFCYPSTSDFSLSGMCLSVESEEGGGTELTRMLSGRASLLYASISLVARHTAS